VRNQKPAGSALSAALTNFMPSVTAKEQVVKFLETSLRRG